MIKYRGAAYYPEFWPQERWDEDIRLMKQAHINIVRIGEFAWTPMEPAEGVFSLDWLHDSVSRLGKAGIDVMLCTPTAAPPAWLTTAYPETLIVDRHGLRARHGGRHHYCPTHPTYRKHIERITEKLAAEFSRHRNVIVWQLDNEIGPEHGQCYCENCAAEFRNWLRRRYGSIEALNAAWQTRFWSVEFTDWREIQHSQDRGNVYPSIELDVKRFFSDCFVDFAACQARIIRRLHPKAMVTSNLMGPILTNVNYYKLIDLFDCCCDDLYFDIGTMTADAAACDVFRCMAPPKPFWITETGSGALTAGKGPYAAQLRAWLWSSLARGSEGHFIFRWRTCPAGQEQELQGILETSGHAGYRYKAVQAMFGEMDKLRANKDLAAMELPKAEVAIISSYDVHWAYEAARIGPAVKELPRLFGLYEQLFDRNVPVDVIPPERDFRGYKLVILPTLCIVDDKLKARLKAYVRSGGVVLATPQLSSRDMNNNYVTRPAPDGLKDLFGLEVTGRNYLDNANEADEALWVPAGNVVHEKVAVAFADGGPRGEAEVYMEEIAAKPKTRVLASYVDNMYQSAPAVLENRFGRGRAMYVAAFLDPALTGHVMEQALQAAAVQAGPWTAKHVEVVRRGAVVFAINHSRHAAEVEMPAGKTIVGEVRDGVAALAPYGVCVVKAGKP